MDIFRTIGVKRLRKPFLCRSYLVKQISGLVVFSAYRLLLTRYLMNRSFLGEVFQEGLANLALDVSRFFLRICCA